MAGTPGELPPRPRDAIGLGLSDSVASASEAMVPTRAWLRLRLSY